MVKHFEDGMFSVFIFFVLEYFFYCYLLACLPVGAEVDNSKSAFACYSLYLVFSG